MEEIKSQNTNEMFGKLEHMERFFKHETSNKDLVQSEEAVQHEDQAVRYEPKALKKILKIILIIFCILTLGGIGGIIADRWAIPYIVSKPGFSQFAWLQRIKENTTIVKTTEEIKISEDLAMIDAIAKTKSSIVAVVVSYNLEQKPIPRSKKPLAIEVYIEKINGVIITGDGLVLARPSGFIPPERLKDKIIKSASYKVVLGDKREFIVTDPKFVYQYDLKTQKDNPLSKTIILKIDASNLPVISFGDMSNVLLGSPAAILGQGVSVGSVAKVDSVSITDGNNIGISWKVIYFDTEVANKDFYAGSPLINIKGEMIGLNIISNDGNMTNSFLSIEDLKIFIDSVLGKK